MKKGLLFIFLLVHLLWFIFGKNVYSGSYKVNNKEIHKNSELILK